MKNGKYPRDLGRGRRFFGSPLQGPAAGPGTYRVKMAVNGQTHTRFITIRQDPLQEAQN